MHCMDPSSLFVVIITTGVYLQRKFGWRWNKAWKKDVGGTALEC